jgi:hypothetical protein
MTAFIELGWHNGYPRQVAVDEQDFDWAMQWSWQYKLDKRGKKYYAVRHGRRTREDGRRVQCDIYMHKAILHERMCFTPKTKHHVIGEHKDGDSLNCRRYNLEWATRSHNCKTAKVKTPRCPVRGRFIPNEDHL